MKNWKDKLREMYFVDSSMHAEYEAFIQIKKIDTNYGIIKNRTGE